MHGINAQFPFFYFLFFQFWISMFLIEKKNTQTNCKPGNEWGQSWTWWKLLGKHAHHWERAEWRSIIEWINSHGSQFRHYSNGCSGQSITFGLLTWMWAKISVLWNMQPCHPNWRCCSNTRQSCTMPWNGQVSVKESRSFCSVGQTSEMMF